MMAIETITWMGLTTAAYLLGAIPFGLLLARRFAGADLRTIGSGNIGATNAKRAGGWPLGLATLFCDLAKGALPVALAVLFSGDATVASRIGICGVAVAAVIGHLYPVYLGFKTGGKGVATAAGCFLVLSPVSILVSIAGFMTTVWLSGRVSAGSLAGAALLPAAVYFVEGSFVITGGALVISGLIIWRHRGNIARLIAGTEPKLSDKERDG